MATKSQKAQWARDWYHRQTPEDKQERHKKRAQTRRDQKSRAVEVMGNKCHDCGGTFPECCYDFHHLDITKDNDVPSNVLQCSWKRVEEMLKECVMLCSNCHRIRHNEDGYLAHLKRN